MAGKSRCEQCGAELPADAPQNLCPQCLMKLGLPTDAGVGKAGASSVRADVSTSDGAPAGFVPPEPAELDEQFEQLEVLELLGQGGMGAVYKARQTHLGRLVALKILPPPTGKDPAFAERFSREARSLAILNHPNIVTVHDFGHTAEGLYYFVMEFVEGTDLRRVLQSHTLSAQQALAIVPQICEALQYAHEEGVVHRDIKPENILLDKKGRVKIADFGLARLLDRPATGMTLTQAGQRMGTPHYMAPEQIERPHDVDHRADIYSLGVVFYEMLTGELPLGRFDPPSQKVHVDVRLDEVVLHTLEKEPERRYQHASDVKSDVETITADSEPSVARADPTPPGAGAGGGGLAAAREVFLGISLQEHVRLVAILRIAWGCLGLAVGALLFGILAGPTIATGDRTAAAIGSTFGGALTLFFVILSVPDIIGGVGLLKRKRWARILTLIMGVLDLVGFPIGTVVGVYTIWVLMKARQAGVFADGLAAEDATPGNPRQPAAGGKPARDRRATVGVVSLLAAILGVVAAVLLLLAFMIFDTLTEAEPRYSLCLLVLLGVEVVALVTGLVGWRSAYGKAGLGVSLVLFLAALFFVPTRQGRRVQSTEARPADSVESVEERTQDTP